MYTSENISTILDFRYQIPTNYEDTGNKPSDELILNAIDLVRKFIKCPQPYIILGMDGLNTVIRFMWDIGSHGVIQYTLAEDYLKLFVIQVTNKEYNKHIISFYSYFQVKLIIK